jgi:hypothetical protein
LRRARAVRRRSPDAQTFRTAWRTSGGREGWAPRPAAELNRDLTVRREAATACLRVAAPQAEAALESVAREGTYPDSLLASEALANWRGKGQIVYGV